MSGSPSSAALDLALAARRVPLVQSPVANFAAKHSPDALASAFELALPNAGAHAATVLAVAAAEKGARLDPTALCKLLPELDSISLFGPLVRTAAGDLVALLIAFLDDGAGAWEREALAVLLASELVSPPPPRLLSHARKLARRSLGLSAGMVLGAAASKLADPHLDTLAIPFIALAKKSHAAIEETLALARLSPLAALPTAAPPRISSGYTVRSDRSVGRNDPCPCGSGKKYKKCCAEKNTEEQVEPTPIDPRLLTPDQIRDLRPSEISELDPRLMSRHVRISGFRRLLDFRRWDAAERFLTAMPARADEGTLEDWRDELVNEAIRQRAHDVVQRHLVQLPEEYFDRRLRILLDCIEKPADLIDRVNAHARAALEAETEREGVEASLSVAFAMLDYFPALGVFVARGALTKERLLDSHTLLDAMEEARDELGVAPYEPWWDIWEQIGENANRSKLSEAERERLERIAADLQRSRNRAEEASTEVAYLQRRLRELEADKSKFAASGSSNEPSPSQRSAEAEEEKRRLRNKVAELQRIVSEGQEERRDLRRRLASTPTERGSPAEPTESALDVEPEVDVESESVERPRRLLIPVYDSRAAKALSDLPIETGESVLLLVAELAAGREHAWRGVKRLRTRDILSARAGIHYRVLFRIEERSLVVANITHRRNLDQVIASL